MDWQTIIQQQETLEKSLTTLKAIFEQAERDFKEKSRMFAEAMGKIQAQDAVAIAQIHKALGAIIEGNNSVKQNPPK